jgi:DNA-binding transcriptional LysR family regulator
MIPTEVEIAHFTELYSVRHFTRASVRLGVTQPTLTQSIFRLEKKIKQKLFHRTKQGCIPTKAADILYDKATRLHELWKDLSTQANHSDLSLSGVFRVGCHQSVGGYTLPKFLKKLSASAPDIEIRLSHDWSRKITEKVINYELDLGFVVNPFKHRDLVLIKLGDDQVAFWKAKGVKSPKKLFADANLVQVQTMLGKRGLNYFEDWQLIETTSLELIRTLVTQGAGLGILPERVAKAEGTLLEKADSSLPTFHDQIFLIYRADTLKGVAARAVIDAAKTCIL